MERSPLPQKSEAIFQIRKHEVTTAIPPGQRPSEDFRKKSLLPQTIKRHIESGSTGSPRPERKVSVVSGAMRTIRLREKTVGDRIARKNCRRKDCAIKLSAIGLRKKILDDKTVR